MFKFSLETGTVEKMGVYSEENIQLFFVGARLGTGA